MLGGAPRPEGSSAAEVRRHGTRVCRHRTRVCDSRPCGSSRMPHAALQPQDIKSALSARRGAMELLPLHENAILYSLCAGSEQRSLSCT